MHKLFNAKRVREVEQYLEEDHNNGIEGVYRCYHGSFKIDWLRYDALKYFNFCLYILGLVNLNVRRTDWVELVKNAKFAKKDTLTRQILDELVKDELDWDSYYKQGKPIDTDPFVVRYCGYYYFFKTVLECLIRYAKERTGKENFFRMVEYWEGVAEYFLMDIDSGRGGKNGRNEGKIIKNNTGKKYWDKYIGKIYPIVGVTTNAAGKTYYKLDMTEDEGGYRIWEADEIEMINERGGETK